MDARIALALAGAAALVGSSASASEPRPEAAVRLYCPLVETIRPGIGDCVDNQLIVAASEDCLKGFADRTLAAQRSLTNHFTNEAAKSLVSQFGQDGNEVIDLEQADAKLHALDQEAQLVLEEQQRYLATLAFAGGIPHSVARQLGMEVLLQGMKCFLGPREALTEHRKKMEQRRKELGTALAAIEKNRWKVNGNVAHLEALARGSKLGTADANSAPHPEQIGSRNPGSSSDITGLRRNEGSDAAVQAAQNNYARGREEGSGPAVQEILRLAREKNSGESP